MFTLQQRQIQHQFQQMQEQLQAQMQQMFAEFRELKRYVDDSIQKLQRPRKRQHGLASGKLSAGSSMVVTDTEDTATSDAPHHG